MDTAPQTELPRIAVITGSTRPGRRTDQVAVWVHRRATDHLHGRAEVVTVDLADQDLPLLDEPLPAAFGEYRHPHTRRWAELVGAFDGFVFVVPEYNHSMPAAVKNAIDYLYAEWNDKAAGFVSFGIHGGVRAAEHLRLVLAETKTACVRTTVALNLFADFDVPDIRQRGTFAPAEHHEPALLRMLDEVVEWSTALRTIRAGRAS
ncbi:NAD(P)H-dependent oxidoreductase [Tsukamurella tyrosinosolvens]|uniref:NADPH-dependent FMN reductase n=1 Tax=Tsukamurella tyrosinosolvens TaxID=57704 RepID=UPI000794E3EA|nr:NAD(P)H-dependent oxidoreductase [Tsukamurella tyrosinosolvens]KXP08019.1 NADPH-dependent FMN reductase [Tsukamurella tyrosinosolvens]KZL97422.1 NADPH-dependent FMN reductase [Tsukamurella tyrosinosolvens]MCA4995997.1 NAD(P)H-dependent oxidoreductase [Tsukamurella tyrosinosolvens]RDB49490.1 NADPH-dependent oxidoreductase [Tsukamurella tyrosinosolvens]